jgi:hypothetical protein
MQRLRSARILARFVLAWFALVVGLAAAAPLVQPQALEMVCSIGGMKLVVVSDGEQGPVPGGASLDCPLCAAIVPPPAVVVLPMPQPLGYALQSIPSSRIAAPTAAPLPARGPPSSFA